jgi:uncharacterized membrane protein
MFLSLNNPIFLTLWLLIPLIWFIQTRSWAKGGWSRKKTIVIGIRSLLIIFLGLALSDPQLLIRSDQVNLFFCLDVSESIPRGQKKAAEAFIKKTTAAMKNEDQAGVILFGKHPSIEISLQKKIDSLVMRSDVNPNFTNIHDALQLAIGKLPQNGKNKIVILSDGNENSHQSLDMAYLAGSLGIEIYPVPLGGWFGNNEAFIETLESPSEVSLETPFEIRLVVYSATDNHGSLVLTRNDGLLAQQTIALQSGINVFGFADRLTKPGLYLYKAISNFANDTYFQNNEGLSFTRGSKKSRILYLTDKSEHSKYLTEALKVQGLDLDIRPIKDIQGSVHGFLDYNAIILDNISARTISFPTMEQIEKYVRDMGGGLILIGGDKSFGAGNYKKTPIEKALPVLMDPPAEMTFSELYLIFVVDKSSSMTGGGYKGKNKLEMAKIAAFSAIEMLNPLDRLGIVAFDTEFEWIVPVTTANQRQKIADQLSRLRGEGGTDLFPALKDVHYMLNQVTAKRKHVIVLSDGETEAADFRSLVESMSASGISISTVAIGKGAHVELMKSIAVWGKGRSYYTDDPDHIPKIFTGEAKIITRKIITEKKMQTRIKLQNEIMQGMNDLALPPVYGQVVTYPKPGARVLVETEQALLLAAWQYGLGRSVAFTSDLSNRWGKDWVLWEHYARFTSQMVKWAQRKESQEHFWATIDRKGEMGTFKVDVTTDHNRFMNNLDLSINLLLPSGQNQTVALDQTAPGRYECTFPTEEIGAYFFSVFGKESASFGTPRTFGFGIPHTVEFKNVGTNEKLLQELATTTNGRVLSIDNPPADLFTASSDSKKSGIPLWPYFVFAFLLFLIIDVTARKLFKLGG